MHIRFWGVRGSVPVSGSEYVGTGGDTPCVELIAQGQRLILDGGTGLRSLGVSWGYRPMRATLLFTHVHWDHIQGIPFFSPLFHPDSQIDMVGASRATGSVRDALWSQMKPPGFPVTPDIFAARVGYRDVRDAQTFDVGPFTITARDLHHPDGVYAYRIEADGRSVVFATDVEHTDGIDPRLVELADGADMLIHDAQYTQDEYDGRGGPSRRGWGHATVGQAVEVARRAQVGRLMLYHHDPQRTDDGVAQLERWAQARFVSSSAARQGPRVRV